MTMWLIIIFLIIAVAFFGFEVYRFVTELKRRKQKRQSSSPEVDKGKEVK